MNGVIIDQVMILNLARLCLLNIDDCLIVTIIGHPNILAKKPLLAAGFIFSSISRTDFLYYYFYDNSYALI
jgi:hypothetical protein